MLKFLGVTSFSSILSSNVLIGYSFYSDGTLVIDSCEYSLNSISFGVIDTDTGEISCLSYSEFYKILGEILTPNDFKDKNMGYIKKDFATFVISKAVFTVISNEIEIFDSIIRAFGRWFIGVGVFYQVSTTFDNDLINIEINYHGTITYNPKDKSFTFDESSDVYKFKDINDLTLDDIKLIKTVLLTNKDTIKEIEDYVGKAKIAKWRYLI